MKRFRLMPLVALLIATPGLAQSTGSATVDRAASGGGLTQVCRADVIALCACVKPGDGKLGMCMRANRSKLSSGCAGALRERRRQRKQS